jgi:hypothetical protein
MCTEVGDLSKGNPEMACKNACGGKDERKMKNSRKKKKEEVKK